MPNSSVELRPVDTTNWEDCLKLKVAPEQTYFVTPVANSLVQATYDKDNGPHLHPLVIYSTVENSIVGFLMYEDGQSPEIRNKGIYFIWSLLVDSSQQGKGYGRAALQLLLERLRSFPDCSRVGVTFDAANTTAEKLYTSFGFTKVTSRTALAEAAPENEQITAILKFF